MVGHDVIRNERIKTASIGQAQLLFTDQSTLTVARNSEILIDEFVFDPNKQSGNLAATVTTGVFRYVGGKISKQKDVTFYTPTGSVSVRGGIVLFKVDGTTVTALFLFGEFMQLNANGHTQRTNQANTSITAIGGGPPSPPVPVNALTIQQLQQELQSNRSTPGNFPGIGEGFGQNGPFGPDVDLLLAANSLNLLPFSPPPPPKAPPVRRPSRHRPRRHPRRSRRRLHHRRLHHHRLRHRRRHLRSSRHPRRRP